MSDAPARPEERDVWPRTLLAFAGGLAVFLAVALLLLYVIFDIGSPERRAGWPVTADWGGPPLQRAPKQDLDVYLQRERAGLESWGWVDRDAGIARIPVDEAMRLVSERGLPRWGALAADADGQCRLLNSAVPRAPQAQLCRVRPGDEQ